RPPGLAVIGGSAPPGSGRALARDAQDFHCRPGARRPWMHGSDPPLGELRPWIHRPRPTAIRRASATNVRVGFTAIGGERRPWLRELGPRLSGERRPRITVRYIAIRARVGNEYAGRMHRRSGARPPRILGSGPPR